MNANIAMVTGFSVHPDAEEAKRRGEDGFKFFGYALGHHYIFGEHKPGHTDIWAAYERARAKLPEAGAARGIGTPNQLRAHLKSFEDSGVDQVAFIQQGGKNRHEHIRQSLDLFARDVLPEFHEREEVRAKRKHEELAPFIEQAMVRKEKVTPLVEDKISEFCCPRPSSGCGRTATHTGARGCTSAHLIRSANTTRKSGESVSSAIAMRLAVVRDSLRNASAAQLVAGSRAS